MVSLTTNPLLSQTDTDFNNRFLSEAPKQWDIYVQKLKLVQGSLRFEFNQTHNTLKTINEATYKCNETCILVESRNIRWINGKLNYDDLLVDCANARYGFHLKHNESASPWVLSGLESNPEFLAQELSTEKQETLAQLIDISTVPLTKLIAQDNFKIHSIKPLDGFVQIDFETLHKPSDKSNGVQKGTMVLDPERYWTMVRYTVEIDYGTMKGTQSCKTIDVAEIGDGLPIPKHIEIVSRFTYSDINEANNQTRILDFTLSIPDELPDEDEFRLPAYGIPEPVEYRKGSYIYLWIVLAGNACVILGMLIFFWLKRRSKASASA